MDNSQSEIVLKFITDFQGQKKIIEDTIRVYNYHLYYVDLKKLNREQAREFIKFKIDHKKLVELMGKIKDIKHSSITHRGSLEISQNIRKLSFELKIDAQTIKDISVTYANSLKSFKSFFHSFRQGKTGLYPVTTSAVVTLHSPARIFVAQKTGMILRLAGKSAIAFVGPPVILCGARYTYYKLRYPGEVIESPVIWEQYGNSWVLSPRKGSLRQLDQIRTIQNNHQFQNVKKAHKISCLSGKLEKVYYAQYKNGKNDSHIIFHQKPILLEGH